MARVSGDVDAEDIWHFERIDVDSAYFVNDFKLRFLGNVSASTEDGNVDNVTLTGRILAGPPNQLPTITSTAPVNATQDVPYTYDVDAVDPDVGDVLTYSLDQAPSGTTIDPITGVINWTPGSAQVGLNPVTVRVQDQRRGSDTQSFVIDVANINDAPTITSSPITTGTEGVAYSYDVDSVDPDPGDSATYSLDVAPAGMTIDANTGVISWTPGSADVGQPNDVTVRVTDGLGEFATQSFSIGVSAPSANVIYVYEISFESKRNGQDWRAVFGIRADSNGDGNGDPGDAPVPGVAIEVTFAGQTFTGVTDGSGVFRTAWINSLSSGNHYANAVDLALTGYAWNLSLWGEDDSDGDGYPDELLTI